MQEMFGDTPRWVFLEIFHPKQRPQLSRIITTHAPALLAHPPTRPPPPQRCPPTPPKLYASTVASDRGGGFRGLGFRGFWCLKAAILVTAVIFSPYASVRFQNAQGLLLKSRFLLLCKVSTVRGIAVVLILLLRKP